jgi:hypothetical protein
LRLLLSKVRGISFTTIAFDLVLIIGTVAASTIDKRIPEKYKVAQMISYKPGDDADAEVDNVQTISE